MHQQFRYLMLLTYNCLGLFTECRRSFSWIAVNVEETITHQKHEPEMEPIICVDFVRC